MTENKTSQAQIKATQKWREKNREKARYNSSKSSARSFIRNYATLEDIEELRLMLDEKEKGIKDGTK